MSATGSADVERAVRSCRPTDVTPVEIDGEELASVAPEYLRDLKGRLAAEGYQPAALSVEACFVEDCSLATQSEVDRLRGYVRAAAFLGAGRLSVEVDDVAECEPVESALLALGERARREGVTLSIEGTDDLRLDGPT